MMLHHSAVEGQEWPSEPRPMEPLYCQDSDTFDEPEVDILPHDQVEEPIEQPVPGAPTHLPISWYTDKAKYLVQGFDPDMAEGAITLGVYGTSGLTKWSLKLDSEEQWATQWKPKAQILASPLKYSPYLGHVGDVELQVPLNLSTLYSGKKAQDRPYTFPVPDSTDSLPFKIFQALLFHKKVEMCPDQDDQVTLQLYLGMGGVKPIMVASCRCANAHHNGGFCPHRIKLPSIHCLPFLFPEYETMFFMASDIGACYWSCNCAEFAKGFVFSYMGYKYRYICLPFGADVAPLLLTQFMEKQVGIVRQQHKDLIRQYSIKILIYLDDVLVMGKNAEAV